MNYDLIFYGNKEFYPKINNKKYLVYKIINSEKIEFMINIFNDFINSLDKYYLAIDFEFNKVSKTNRDIALMQINIENDNDIAYIFVLYPPMLNNSQLNILIKLITKPNAIKILHGSESLDIPYLFNQLLISKDNINNFCQNFYDTKYLCDYNNINKCGIYDFLENENIMTKNKKKELEDEVERMGPLYLIQKHITNLRDDIFMYSLYDVLYLPQLIKKFDNNLEYKIISEISCLINKYKRNIESDFENIKNEINLINNYFIYDNNNKIILKDLWETYFWIIDDNNNYISKLKNINYFKKFLEIFTKMIFYYNINNKYKIYKNKNSFIKKLNIDNYLKWLSYYTNFNNLLKEYSLNINKEFFL